MLTDTLVKTPVKYLNLPRQYRRLEPEILDAVSNILRSGDFILGAAVETFETRFAAYCGTRYAVGVANGTDALVLSFKALGIGPGDEVITAPNSFLSTASAIVLSGARPVFADVRDDLTLDPEKAERAITPRTRAILPVHLTGRLADVDALASVARKHGLHLIEDAAQAVGAASGGKRAGAFGIAGCFSLHPLKNLNACGDGGIVTTDDLRLAERLRQLRNHGLRNRDECDFWGHNSRLDTLQAAILNVKFDHLDDWTEARRANARFYARNLAGCVDVPQDRPGERAVYHTFVVQCDGRDGLQAFLAARDIETKVHYPVPIHLQEAARHLGYVPGDFPVAEAQARRILSLPIYPELTQQEKTCVVRAIQEFYAR